MSGWSIVRPTCRGLSENRLVGPLLTDPQMHTKYMEYVKEFVEDVYANIDLQNEMKEHYDAIKSIADESPDSKTHGPSDISGLFEFMDKRTNNVLRQWVLWNIGEFPESASIDSIQPCMTTDYREVRSILGIAIGVGAAVLGLFLAIAAVCIWSRRK